MRRSAPWIPNHRAFTLVEMMVVVAIIALLLVAAVPAFRSLTQSGGRKGAVSNLMNTLEHARALAVSSGRATYVVFADHTTPEKYRCRAYAVYHENEVFTPQPITKWYFLATGVSFRPNSGLLTSQDPPEVAFQCPAELAGGPQALPFIKFDSSGMVADSTGGLWADLFAGFVSEGGQQTFTDKQQEQSQKYDAVVVAPFTGRVRYVDPYG